MTELKPCPFCGGPSHATVRPECGFHIAGCMNEDCIGRAVAYDFVDQESAIAAWNKRTPFVGEIIPHLPVIEKHISNLQEEVEMAQDTAIKLGGMLTQIANTLKGDPAPNHGHSTHDLPELVAKLKDAVANLIKVKGKHHEEIAYANLVKVFENVTTLGQPAVAEDVGEYKYFTAKDSVVLTATEIEFDKWYSENFPHRHKLLREGAIWEATYLEAAKHIREQLLIWEASAKLGEKK